MGTAEETLAPDGRAPSGGRFHRLYYGQTKFDFVRRRRIWFTLSCVIIGAGIISLAVRGLNYNIEFVGGTSWQVADNNGVTVSQAQAAVSAAGVSNATVTTLGNSGHTSLEVEAKLSNGRGSVDSAEQARVSDALARLTHTAAASVSVEAVGPTWGGQVTHKAVEALIVFIVMISAYISIFFEWKMALAAIIAVLHDIMVTVGVYSLTFFLVTPDTVVAFLTVLGYSLYDTIVVFDRIRDNTKGLGATGKLSFTDVVNLSMNQTLARSINTSLVAILPILSVLVLGADILGATTLEYFGLALLIGLTSGAYSSIFIASPLVAMLKEREPRYTQIRQRLEARSGAVQLLTPAAVAAGILDEREQRGTARRQSKGRAAVPQGGPIRPRSAGGGQTSTALLDEPVRDGAHDDPGMDVGERPAAASSPARAPRSTSRARQPQKSASTARPRKKKRH